MIILSRAYFSRACNFLIFFSVVFAQSSKGGTYRLNFPFVHLVKEMYGGKVGQKWMDNEFKMATVDGWKMKV